MLFTDSWSLRGGSKEIGPPSYNPISRLSSAK